MRFAEISLISLVTLGGLTLPSLAKDPIHPYKADRFSYQFAAPQRPNVPDLCAYPNMENPHDDRQIYIAPKPSEFISERGGFHQSSTVPRDLYETLTPPERYDIDKDCAHIFEMPKYKLKIEANPYVWVNDPERGRILKLKEFEVKREQPKKMLAPLF